MFRKEEFKRYCIWRDRIQLIAEESQDTPKKEKRKLKWKGSGEKECPSKYVWESV